MVNVSRLVGTKFVDGGRVISEGVDCWGLVMEVFRLNGIKLPDYTVDAFAFALIDKLAHEAMGFAVWEKVNYPQDEDAPLVVLMRMHPIFITHAGVYIGNNRIIHTMKGTDAIISKASSLKTHIVGYYRCLE